MLRHHAMNPQAFLVNHFIKSVQEKWYRVGTVSLLVSPKDRNWEVWKRSNSSRKRIGNSVPRAETSGDLITADHKVVSEDCESRNNHPYAVVEQELATQQSKLNSCEK